MVYAYTTFSSLDQTDTGVQQLNVVMSYGQDWIAVDNLPQDCRIKLLSFGKNVCLGYVMASFSSSHGKIKESLCVSLLF